MVRWYWHYLAPTSGLVFAVGLGVQAMANSLSEASASAPSASARVVRGATPGGFVNRSLITVGSDAYTSLDGRLLLALWNSVGEPAVPMVTDFESDPSTWASGQKEELASGRATRLTRYGPDARRLLFILFVWDESRRLGLFVPSDKVLGEARSQVQESVFATASPVDVRRFWQELGATGQRVYLNMILRAKTYLRVRGDLDANPRLSDPVWFWHGLSEP